MKRRIVAIDGSAALAMVLTAAPAAATHKFDGKPITADDVCLDEQGARHFGQMISFIAKKGKVGNDYNPGARYHEEPGFNICGSTPASPTH